MMRESWLGARRGATRMALGMLGVQPLDDLVAVGLLLGEQLQQQERQDALEQLGIVVGGHRLMVHPLLCNVKYPR